MDITWYGHSCFRITERGRLTVVTDPYSETIGLPALKLKGDVVTISHDEPGHSSVEAVRGVQHVLTGPGEYEIGGVFVNGIAMHFVQGNLSRRNIAYVINYDDLNVLHLGDLAHVPDQSQIQELGQFGQINALLVPVGGGMGLKASQAADVVALIEPHYVIPMHYELPSLALNLEPVDKFLKAMGVSKVQEAETLRITTSDLPEQTQVIVLTPQNQQVG